jgi:hypothetical protein
MNNDAYQYTERDVEKTLHFLSTNYPKIATPENAIKVLVYMRDQTRSIEELSHEELNAILYDD